MPVTGENNNNKQYHNNNVEINLGSWTTVICDILPSCRHNCSDINKHCNISENITCDGNYIYRLLTLLYTVARILDMSVFHLSQFVSSPG